MFTESLTQFGRRSFAKLAAAGAVMALTGTGALAQDDAANFYEGKTVTIYVGFSPGGGYDLYGRLAADFLGDHIPGNPTVIVENMPGAGGRRAAQFLYQAAPQDGTALSVIVQSIALDSATGAIPGDLDASEFNAIGRLTANYEMGIVWHEMPVKSFEDAKVHEIAFGSTGAGSASYFVPKMLNDIEGTKFNVIAGYRGTSASTLAMEQGEIDAAMIGLAGLRASCPDWLPDGTAVPIWQLAVEPHPDFPDVPAVGQLGNTDAEKEMLRLVAGAASVGRSLVTTPNVPAERVEILRTAFDEMLQDADFQAAVTQRNQEIDPATGAELQQIIADQMNVSDAAIEQIRGYLVAE